MVLPNDWDKKISLTLAQSKIYQQEQQVDTIDKRFFLGAALWLQQTGTLLPNIK